MRVFLRCKTRPICFISRGCVVKLRTNGRSHRVPQLIRCQAKDCLRACTRFINCSVTRYYFSRSKETIGRRVIRHLTARTNDFRGCTRVIRRLILPTRVLGVRQARDVLRVAFSTNSKLLITCVGVFLFRAVCRIPGATLFPVSFSALPWRSRLSMNFSSLVRGLPV